MPLLRHVAMVAATHLPPHLRAGDAIACSCVSASSTAACLRLQGRYALTCTSISLSMGYAPIFCWRLLEFTNTDFSVALRMSKYASVTLWYAHYMLRRSHCLACNIHHSHHVPTHEVFLAPVVAGFDLAQARAPTSMIWGCPLIGRPPEVP